MTRPAITQKRPKTATGAQPRYRLESPASGFLSALLTEAAKSEGRIEEIGHRSAAGNDQQSEEN